MTALKEFVRLESPGIWRPHEGAQRRDVVVSFGKSTLVISDSAGRILSHWSLPAIERFAKSPGRYRPGPDSGEELELDEPLMIEAIAKLQAALTKTHTPNDQRRKRALWGLAAACVMALGLLVPEVLVRQGLSLAHPAIRSEISDKVLAELAQITGAPCTSFGGQNGLSALSTRLGTSPGASVFANITPDSLSLPDGRIVLSARVVEDVEQAEAAAGYLLAEAARQAQGDPFEPLLRQASLTARAQFLTKAELPQKTLAAYAESLLTQDARPVATDAMLAAFKEKKLLASPYAYAIDPTGETVLDLLESDAGRVTEPLIQDGQWVALQNICGS
ncbi:MAG: hypothetical protein AAGD04_06415 [Pseudomonadota bacterium]